MDAKQLIIKTPTYKKLVNATPFLKSTLLKKSTTESVDRIIYQIEKFGEDYIKDKNYHNREVLFAKEIIEIKNAAQ